MKTNEQSKFSNEKNKDLLNELKTKNESFCEDNSCSENSKDSTIIENDKIEIIAKKILKNYQHAFEELGK